MHVSKWSHPRATTTSVMDLKKRQKAKDWRDVEFLHYVRVDALMPWPEGLLAIEEQQNPQHPPVVFQVPLRNPMSATDLKSVVPLDPAQSIPASSAHQNKDPEALGRKQGLGGFLKAFLIGVEK